MPALSSNYFYFVKDCRHMSQAQKNNGHRSSDDRIIIGGDKRDRTADLLHAMQALSQLSYAPKKKYLAIIIYNVNLCQ